MEADYGWVALHRKIRNNTFLMKDNNAYIVFTKLFIFVNSHGQWAGGKHQLAEHVNIPAGTLYETLRRLQANHMITIAPNRKYTVYTICNWTEYQPSANRSKGLLSNHDPTMTQPQANRQPTTGQHSYNKKKENKKDKDNHLDVGRIEIELAAKEAAARQPREGSGLASARQVAEKLRKRKFDVAW